MFCSFFGVWLALKFRIALCTLRRTTNGTPVWRLCLHERDCLSLYSLELKDC
uniref:Uncharacterized protein n=1 Tax=Pristhesancus plagipennis TaxID=1955184 RepID=A0A2K8JSH2_PRIPG|nr:secreted hypothetical protein [Pristhesancus plagipennis]